MTNKKSTRKDNPETKDDIIRKLEKKLAQLEKKMPAPASDDPDYTASAIGTYSRLYFVERTSDKLHEILRVAGWSRHSFRDDNGNQIWYYSRYGNFTRAQLTAMVGYAPSHIKTETYVPFRPKSRR